MRARDPGERRGCLCDTEDVLCNDWGSDCMCVYLLLIH